MNANEGHAQEFVQVKIIVIACAPATFKALTFFSTVKMCFQVI